MRPLFDRCFAGAAGANSDRVPKSIKRRTARRWVDAREAAHTAYRPSPALRRSLERNWRTLRRRSSPMARILWRTILATGTLVLALVWTSAAVWGQAGAKNGEWRSYGGDQGHTRYSPLDQVSADNFRTLEVAWRFKTDHLGPRPEFKFEGTPLMIGGVLYTTAGARRAVVALDAATGEELWMHSEREGPRGTAGSRLLSGRGLAYWTDGKEERI